MHANQTRFEARESSSALVVNEIGARQRAPLLSRLKSNRVRNSAADVSEVSRNWCKLRMRLPWLTRVHSRAFAAKSIYGRSRTPQNDRLLHRPRRRAHPGHAAALHRLGGPQL